VSSNFHLFITPCFHPFKILCHPSTICSSIKLIIHLYLYNRSITNSSIQYYHPSNIEVIHSINLHKNGHLSFIQKYIYHSFRRKFVVHLVKHHLWAHCTTWGGIQILLWGGGMLYPPIVFFTLIICWEGDNSRSPCVV
jgi:hypothetical protein